MKRHPPLWCSGLLLVLLLASPVWGENLQGDGSVNNPYRWDGGLVGVTATCEVYTRASPTSPWRTALENTVLVDGTGTLNDPRRITGGIKGLACPSTGGRAEVKIVYWDGTSWVDIVPQQTENPTGTSATADATILTPQTTTTSAGTALPFLATSQRGKQLDEVWVKIRGFIVKASNRKISQIWHGGWKNFNEVYPSGKVGEVTPTNLCFPITSDSFESNRDNFGSPRNEGARCHAGIDLFTRGEAKVVAIDGGTIISKKVFIRDCENGKGWRVLIYHPRLGKTINYAELNANSPVLKLAEGASVSRGQFLGTADVCADEGKTMLHLEMYEGIVDEPTPWPLPSGTTIKEKNQCDFDPTITKPALLLNPATFLSTIRNNFCDVGSTVAPVPVQYESYISKAAQQFGVEAALIKAVMRAENSDFGPNDVSSGACVGLMQICSNSAGPEIITVQCAQNTDTGSQLCAKSTCATGRLSSASGVQWCDHCSSGSTDCAPDDRFNPEKNILAGARVLRNKMNAVGDCGMDKNKAFFAAYNLGQEYVRRAVNTVGNCDDWNIIAAELQKNTDSTANTIYGDTKTYNVQNKLQGLQNYVNRAYAGYVAYRSSTTI